MINRVKTLVVLIFGVLGLSGCIVVDDDIPTYTSYPYGSYEAAVDYYHRPPRYYHHTYKTHVTPKKHHVDEPHHNKKPKQPEKIHDKKMPKHQEKVHDKKMPEHPDSKKMEIKKPQPEQPKKMIKEKSNPQIREHIDLKRKDMKNTTPGHHTFKHR